MHHARRHPSRPRRTELADSRPWYALLTKYHWFVLAVCALGWLFDCLDQQLFILARPQAMEDLLKYLKDSPDFKFWTQTFGDISTSVFIAGWASGGLIFGMLGRPDWACQDDDADHFDLFGLHRASALSQTVYDFAFYRFLTGLGVGGEFAVGVALRRRGHADQGPYSGPRPAPSTFRIREYHCRLINLQLGLTEEEGLPMARWRLMFVIGALPAILALLIRGRLKEPEKWVHAKVEGKATVQLGSYAELFGDPVWRKHAILGLLQQDG